MVRKCRKSKGMVEAGYVRTEEGKTNLIDGGGVSSTYMQLRSRRIVYVSFNTRSEKSSSVTAARDDEICVSSNLSCSESNEYYSAKRNMNIVGDDDDEFIDLEEDTETSTYRRSTKRKLFENLREQKQTKSMEKANSPIFQSLIKESDGRDSSKATESSECCCSGRRSSPSEEKVKSKTEKQPTEAEIEEFFAVVEKQLDEKFKKKYNFDFEKEKPLEGRYEWVKLSE